MTFTIGGMTGVLMSVPAIDFQLHNSLFLVAHFHNMIIGGVLFGYFAGFTYWFPKVTGFRLNERLGIYAFWLWIIGFILAFMPIYALGLMGAARRIDSYDPSLGWQSLFIVSAIGVVIIMAVVAMQLLQLAYSVWKRHEHRDVTGDPWDGRSLEWSVPSPAPVYNFARIPAVTERDAFWEQKQAAQPQNTQSYEDIELPRNTGMGIIIAGFSFVMAFALIWHIWWLAAIGLIGAIGTFIYRTTLDITEQVIPAAEVTRIETEFMKRRKAA